jgi:hypothetical protein
MPNEYYTLVGFVIEGEQKNYNIKLNFITSALTINIDHIFYTDDRFCNFSMLILICWLYFIRICQLAIMNSII